MVNKFNALRSRMSAAAQVRAESKTKEMLIEMYLNALRQERGDTNDKEQERTFILDTRKK